MKWAGYSALLGSTQNKISPVSYLIKTDDTRIDFELNNTPLANFYSDFDSIIQEIFSPYIVNGISVPMDEIKKVVFGESYVEAPSIGDHFFEATLITSIDLSPFVNVTSIGDYFLTEVQLPSIDLSAFTKVTSIGDYFLGYTQLTSVDLSALNKVTSIGDFFLVVTPLTSVDLSALNKVTSIGDYFLAGTQLTSVDLSALNKVTSIGDYFLGYTQLTSIQIGDITIPTVGYEGFSGVENISTSTIYADSTAIGNAFKAKFPNLSNWTVVQN